MAVPLLIPWLVGAFGTAIGIGTAADTIANKSKIMKSFAKAYERSDKGPMERLNIIKHEFSQLFEDEDLKQKFESGMENVKNDVAAKGDKVTDDTLKTAISKEFGISTDTSKDKAPKAKSEDSSFSIDAMTETFKKYGWMGILGGLVSLWIGGGWKTNVAAAGATAFIGNELVKMWQGDAKDNLLADFKDSAAELKGSTNELGQTIKGWLPEFNM